MPRVYPQQLPSRHLQSRANSNCLMTMRGLRWVCMGTSLRMVGLHMAGRGKLLSNTDDHCQSHRIGSF